MILWLLIGLLGAIPFIAVARIKPNYELQVLAIGLAIAPLIYVGFAIFEHPDQSAITTEILGAGIYSVFAVLGLRYSVWWLMVGWIAHPMWDIGLHVAGAGTVYTPVWYAIACLSLDLTVAIYIFIGILKRQVWTNHRNQSETDVA